MKVQVASWDDFLEHALQCAKKPAIYLDVVEEAAYEDHHFPLAVYGAFAGDDGVVVEWREVQGHPLGEIFEHSGHVVRYADVRRRANERMDERRRWCVGNGFVACVGRLIP